MANTVTNTANVQVLSTEDSTGNVLVNRTVQPSLDVVFGGSAFYALTPDNLPHAIVFPLSVTVVKHFYMRNLGAAGSILLTGALAPNPTVSGNLALLGPGDVWFYWQASTGAPAVTGQVQGYWQFGYQGSAASIPFEYFVGT